MPAHAFTNDPTWTCKDGHKGHGCWRDPPEGGREWFCSDCGTFTTEGAPASPSTSTPAGKPWQPPCFAGTKIPTGATLEQFAKLSPLDRAAFQRLGGRIL
jgi:hypothetical protein